MKIVLRPLNRDSWSGYIRYPRCFDRLGSYLKRSGARYTGLSIIDEERLGKELGKNLNQNSDFWDTFHLRLDEKDYVIDTSLGPEKELEYLFVTNGHKRIAASLRERKPTADYVVINVEEDAKEVNKLARFKRQAYTELDKLTVDEMRKALRVLGINSTNVSAELAESTLTRLIEENPQKFIDLWVNNKNKETQFLIEEAVASNVLRKVKTSYKYGTDMLGYTLDDAIQYLNNPTNRDVKSAIWTQVEAKKSVFSGDLTVDEAVDKVIQTRAKKVNEES